MDNMEHNNKEANVWCGATGDVATGDVIQFTEAVFEGSFSNPAYVGDRNIMAEVLRESYGAVKQQHTFTLRIIKSSGTKPILPGAIVRRKGRNIYRNGTLRLMWADETARDKVLADKHSRGDIARVRRDERREYEPNFAVS